MAKLNWDDFKAGGFVVRCLDNAEKEAFFAACKKHGVLSINLSPFAIRERFYFLCSRSNGRLELFALTEGQCFFRCFQVIEWRNCKK